jgi:hypothetical protein
MQRAPGLDPHLEIFEPSICHTQSPGNVTFPWVENGVLGGYQLLIIPAGIGIEPTNFSLRESSQNVEISRVELS